jgi:hypothetical protein
MKKGACLRALPVLLSVVAGCADIRGESVNLEPLATGSAPLTITLARDVHVDRSSRALPKGSGWLQVGSIAQGDVYRPRETVFSVEAINVHEAYLVLSGGKLVGYYLPVERTYVSEPKPINIPIQ